ncbi:MAG: NAD(P)-binding domain-containing protein [Polyangiaceae bacterium]
MKIGIFGSGMIGGTLAKLWVNAGHEVQFGARAPEQTRAKAQSIDARVGVDTLSATSKWAEAVLLAIPLHATPDVASSIAEGVRGKPVLDAGNAIPRRDGAAADAAGALGTGPWVAAFLPGAHVVKAYNTVYYQTIATQAHRAPPLVGVPLCGDDEGALSVAERLVRDSGLEPVRVGKLADSRSIDFGSPVWNSNMTRDEIIRALGVGASQ